MKYVKLSLIMLLAIGSTLQAGRGAAIGIGSGMFGYALGKASSEPRTVVVHDSGSSRSERRLRRENDDLRDRNDTQNEKIEKLRDEVSDLKDNERNLERKLKSCERKLNKKQKSSKSSSWFGQSEKEIEDDL